jgi:patatin-like phospholipase/acyl hydrolase
LILKITKINEMKKDLIYNILSLDGGGIRGLILLKQLIKLEEELGKPLYTFFDLIAGTSTGAIIGVLLSLGFSAKELLDFYTIHGEKIFNKKWYRLGIFRPKYDDDYFNDVIKRYIGERTLKDVYTDVLVVGYDITTKDKLIFKSKKAKVDDKYNYSLFDVIRSTASAPTFFKPHQMNKSNNYIVDGGLVINNPSMISWIEVVNYDIKYDKVNIISFSTGTKEKPVTKKVIRGGQLFWASPTVDILLSEQSQMTDYFMTALFARENGKYTRCISVIDKSSGKIDDVSKENIQNMLIDGDKSALNNLDIMRDFCKSIK